MQRYHPILVALHWLRALMIVIALAATGIVLAKMEPDSPDKVKDLARFMFFGIAIVVLLMVLVSFAEHSGFVTAAWKNIFDWMSRIEMKLWQGKHLVMLAASPGSRAGAKVLASQTLLVPHFGAELRGTLGIGKWAEAWDADGARLVRQADIAALDDLLARLRPGTSEMDVA